MLCDTPPTKFAFQEQFIAMNLRLRAIFAAFLTFFIVSSVMPVRAANRTAARRGGHAASAGSSGGAVYQQFLLNGKPDHWIRDQMPIKVYVSHGTTLDGFVDSMGAPKTNTSNTAGWPDLVMQVMDHPEQLNSLPQARGYTEQQYQAAVEGISMWKALEKEGTFSFQFTDDPSEADIYVFWTPHFVNNLGLALFENDTRGYTSLHPLPFDQVQAAMQRGDLALIRRSLKPVVTLLCTLERQDSTQISYAKMKACAAHEFGHALGINGHSPYPTDLMNVSYGRGLISANDAATMRYLYRLNPAYMP